MATSRFEIHARRYTNEKGDAAHISLTRNHFGDVNDGFDCIELAVDGHDCFILYIDPQDFPNFPTYDSNNDSKGDTSE